MSTPRCCDCKHARETHHSFCFWTCALVVHPQTGKVEWPYSSCEKEREMYRGAHGLCGWEGKNFEPIPSKQPRKPSWIERVFGGRHD